MREKKITHVAYIFLIDTTKVLHEDVAHASNNRDDYSYIIHVCWMENKRKNAVSMLRDDERCIFNWSRDYLWYPRSSFRCTWRKLVNKM